MMAAVTHKVYSRQEAEALRRKILEQIGNEQKFRERGESYELDADELVLYDDLLTLDYLLGD